MSTVQAPPSDVSRFELLAQQRRVEEALRALHARGWDERVQPLATHMVAQRLVRALGYARAPARQIDLEVLREALSALLRDQWEDGSLIVQLVLDGLEPALVAVERGVSRRMLVDLLRDAIGKLAIVYENKAYASVGASKRASPAGPAGPPSCPAQRKNAGRKASARSRSQHVAPIGQREGP
jgi:hypothetical protein